jgi:hypothetical protein
MTRSIPWPALLALPFVVLALPVADQQRSDSPVPVASAPRTSEPKAALAPAALVSELRRGG